MCFSDKSRQGDDSYAPPRPSKGRKQRRGRAHASSGQPGFIGWYIGGFSNGGGDGGGGGSGGDCGGGG